MTPINESLKQIVTTAEYPYILGSWAQINKSLDAFAHSEQFPAVLHLESKGGSVSFTADGEYVQLSRLSERVAFGVGSTIPLDYDPQQTADLTETLIDAGIDIISQLTASGVVEPISDASYTVLYDEFDANLVVVLWEFTATEAEGRC